MAWCDLRISPLVSAQKGAIKLISTGSAVRAGRRKSLTASEGASSSSTQRRAGNFWVIARARRATLKQTAVLSVLKREDVLRRTPRVNRTQNMF